MPPALDRSLHSSLHPLLAIIIHTLDYYDIRARRHRYRSGKLTCLEEEHIISTICHSSQFLPEVAETEVIRRWAQAVTTTIWEKAYLTETAKKQISDIIDSEVAHVAYGPKMTVKQSYLKVAERTGLHPDQVQVVVESIMALAVERIALGEEFDIADRIRLKKTRGKKTKVRARCMHKLFVDVGRNTAPPEVHTPQLFFN